METRPFQGLAVVALLSYALREPFAGAVQYYLSNYNAGVLWFIPDAIGLVCIVALLAFDLAFNRSLKFFFLIAIILYYMLLGYITSGSFAASLSGFKALLPLFVGLIMSRQVLQRSSVQTVLMALLLIAVVGVWWSSFSELPWAQLSFDSGLVVRKFRATVWAANNTYRPFGFANDQHAAGSSILFLLALIGVSNRQRLFYLLSAPAGWAIFISTSRTSLVGFGILMAFRLLHDVLERRNRAHLTGVLTAVVPFVVIAVPFCVMGFAQAYTLGDIPPALASLWIRGNEVFAQPFNFMPIFAPNAWLFGFGLGGVGFPLNQSDYSSYAAIIDNFFLFSYYSFGVPFLLFYLAICWRNTKEQDVYKRILLCVTVIFGQFILGWANGMFMLVFGYASSAAFLGEPSLRSQRAGMAYS